MPQALQVPSAVPQGGVDRDQVVSGEHTVKSYNNKQSVCAGLRRCSGYIIADLNDNISLKTTQDEPIFS